MKLPYILILSTAMLSGLISGTTQAQPTQQNWTDWQSTSDKGIDVRYDRDPSVWVTWWWQLRNRYNQKVVIHYSRLYGNGQRMDTEAVAEANGIAEDNNMGGDYNPAIQIIRIEFPDSSNSSPSSSSDSTSPSSTSTAATELAGQQQQAALERQQELQRQIAAQQAALDAQREKSLDKIQSYQNASDAVQNGANQIGQILQQDFDEQQAKEAAEREQAKLDREQARLERLQEEASKTPEQRAAEEQEQQREADRQTKAKNKIISLFQNFAGTWEVAPDFISTRNTGGGWGRLISGGSLKLSLIDPGTIAVNGEFHLDERAKDITVQHEEFDFNIVSGSLNVNEIPLPAQSDTDNAFWSVVRFAGSCHEDYYQRNRLFARIDGFGDLLIDCTLGVLALPIGVPATFLSAQHTSNDFQSRLIFSTDGKLYLGGVDGSAFFNEPIPLKKQSE
jgi:hypothetical protein